MPKRTKIRDFKDIPYSVPKEIPKEPSHNKGLVVCDKCKGTGLINA